MTVTTTALLDPVHDGVVGSDDVTRPQRRRFGADYKRAILEEYDRLTERERFLHSVDAGLADADAGRIHTTGEVRRRLGLTRKGAR